MSNRWSGNNATTLCELHLNECIKIVQGMYLLFRDVHATLESIIEVTFATTTR